MGQLERYGLYVLCLVIFLILGVAIWGGDPVAASPLPVVIFSDEDGEEMVKHRCPQLLYSTREASWCVHFFEPSRRKN